MICFQPTLGGLLINSVRVAEKMPEIKGARENKGHMEQSVNPPLISKSGKKNKAARFPTREPGLVVQAFHPSKSTRITVNLRSAWSKEQPGLLYRERNVSQKTNQPDRQTPKIPTDKEREYSSHLMARREAEEMTGWSPRKQA